MKLGEALAHRTDLQTRLAQLHDRLRASVIVQEGDDAPEDANDLLQEATQLADELEKLITNINFTNSRTKLPWDESVTSALARREVLALRQGVINSAISAARESGIGRYSRSEIRYVRLVDIGDLRKQADELAQTRRELDAAIQEHNWKTDLLEA